MIADVVAAACVLLLYAAVMMIATPYIVTHRRWTSRMPRTAMTVWVGALGSGGIAMLASLGCVIAAASDLAARPQRAQTLSLRGLLSGIGLTMAACLMTAVGGGLICVIAYRSAVGIASRRRLRTEVATALAATTPLTRAASTVVVSSHQPSAVSVPGRHPVIMVSSTLRDALPSEQLEAVIEHERGHLAQRHHLLLQLAQLQYRCAPVLPCARSLEQSIHLLIELAADDHAARRSGRRTTADALRAMGAATGDAGLQLRAHRLEAGVRPHRRRAARG